jgi:hypothetical protein
VVEEQVGAVSSCRSTRTRKCKSDKIGRKRALCTRSSSLPLQHSGQFFSEQFRFSLLSVKTSRHVLVLLVACSLR